MRHLIRFKAELEAMNARTPDQEELLAKLDDYISDHMVPLPRWLSSWLMILAAIGAWSLVALWFIRTFG